MRIGILLIFLLQVYGAAAQTGKTNEVIADRNYKKAIKAAKEYIDSLQASQHIPGISICVGNREKILWAQGFGYADLENKSPVTVHSMFRLGSVSKVMTSLAVGRLYEQGKLDLDAPVQKYVPEFPEKKYPITTRQLAAHQAGIRHYADKDPIAIPVRYNSVKDGLKIFSGDSLIFKPGTAYSYSSYGFNLLSAVVEAAAGKDFPSYMLDSVFRPLGMKNSSPDFNDSIIVGRVRFYELTKTGGVVNAALVDDSYKWAGGGMLGAPMDLVNMVRALLNHQYLNDSTQAVLFRPQSLADGKKTNVGIAWRIDENKAGMKYIHHGGTVDGGRTFILFYPESGYVFAIAANVSGAKLNVGDAEKVLGFFINK